MIFNNIILLKFYFLKSPNIYYPLITKNYCPIFKDDRILEN